MLRPLPLLLAAALAATGCARLAESRINPLNWFGGSRPVAAQAGHVPLVPEGQGGTYDLRQPIAQVTDMAIERTDSGAILRATGLAPAQGYHNAQLVLVGRENGVLTYEFRVAPPPAPTGGPQAITVARTLNAGDLAGITAVRVLAQANAREARR